MEALSVMDLEEIVEDEEVVSEIDAIPTGPLAGSWETPMGGGYSGSHLLLKG